MEDKPKHPARRLPSAGTDYRTEWLSMARADEAAAQPQSQEEFDAWVRWRTTGRQERSTSTPHTRSQRKQRSVDSEEEEDIFYPPTGYRGEWLYRLLCASNPARARRRIERVYWLSWSSFTFGILLSSFGLMLFALGSVWTYFGEERIRGVGVLLAATLLCIPGFYSLFVLLMYVRGKKGYSYRQLPED